VSDGVVGNDIKQAVEALLNIRTSYCDALWEDLKLRQPH